MIFCETYFVRQFKQTTSSISLRFLIRYRSTKKCKDALFARKENVMSFKNNYLFNAKVTSKIQLNQLLRWPSTIKLVFLFICWGNSQKVCVYLWHICPQYVSLLCLNNGTQWLGWPKTFWCLKQIANASFQVSSLQVKIYSAQSWANNFGDSVKKIYMYFFLFLSPAIINSVIFLLF